MNYEKIVQLVIHNYIMILKDKYSQTNSSSNPHIQAAKNTKDQYSLHQTAPSPQSESDNTIKQ